LTDWLNDELLQAIAAENNLSETAFILEDNEGYQIRWFTPKSEINLCGHATLAAGFLLFELGKSNSETIKFSSLSGELFVHRQDHLMVMDFPRLGYSKLENTDILTDVVNVPLTNSYTSELDYLVVLDSESDVLHAQVNSQLLADLPKRGLIITSKSNDYDFYSRCFYPKYNIPEDPVTGSAHCVLAPYWADQLGKNNLRAIQGSYRKGEVFCEVLAERVNISGHCKWYFKGHLML
jgi:PhzF family phenazine biosynthesis protein